MRDLRENCRNKCKEKIDDTVRQKLFDEYWALGTHDKRVAFVASLINLKETAITRNKVSGKATKTRLHTYVYQKRTKKKKTAIDIHLPRDWYQLVRSANKKKQFKVEVMDQDRFFSFSELITRTGPLQIKNKEFKWRNICWLRYTKDSFLKYKNRLNDDEDFKEVKFMKKNQNVRSLKAFLS